MTVWNAGRDPLKHHDDWVPVAEGELRLISRAEVITHTHSLDIPGSVWACSLCTDFDATGRDMKVHLIKK